MASGALKTLAPKPLATPTDLSPDAVQAICEAVNPLIADAFALYIKTKNYHWHLAGSHFRDYHLLLDEQAASVLASIDQMAERVRKIGGTTLRSVSHVGRLQTIEDDEDEFVPAEQMLMRLIEDNRRVAEHQRAAIDVCDEARDHGTGSLLETLLDETEKRIWFLFEACQGGQNAR